MQFRLPADWAEAYRNADYLHIDPLPRVAAQRTLPFWWSEVEKMTHLDADERAYLKTVRAQNFCPGLAIPVFGPNGRHGYSAAGIGHERAKMDEHEIAELHAACQLAHLRFCDLIIDSLPDHVNLSDRERQILSFVVRGHSNQMTE